MVKDISLFEHNEKAYEALIASLEQNPLAFIEHATGTGKSFILLKYLYTKMRNKKILFVTRHYEMLEQLFNEQMNTLGISKDDFLKFDTTIYPNILDMDMNDIINNYDCIVWDEAHHCGAPKWSVKINELKELVKKTKGKQMIGATATRIRYLDDYMDVCEKFFDGNIVSELPVTRAILKNLLPAPSIIMTPQACQEQIERVQKKLRKVPQTQEIKNHQKYVENLQDYLSDEFSVGNVLKKYGVKKGEKYIIFCSDINDLKRKMKDAESWFKDIGPIKMYSAHSGQKRSTNIEQIKDFSNKREEISLMFAVDIFNEGFHVDGVDGILTFRKTKSPIIYWQQLGRALSFSARKKQIKIFDFANNTSDNKVVYELYKEMLEEAKRLMTEDPANKDLYEEILSHFEIVDQTTSILDKLQEIETKIDKDYIIKNKVDLAILKLEEYRQYHQNTNFNDLLSKGQIDFEYVRAYNYLCDIEDYLTTEQVLRLQKLNISFTTKIDLPKEKRLEILGENQSFKELENQKLDDFIKRYIDFCTKNNHRPTIEEDKELYLLYRKYLKELTKSKLNKLLSKIPMRLSLEEIVIQGGYPSREDINSYVEMLKQKIKRNITLDSVEIKVLKKISHVIPEKDSILLEYLNKYSSINYQISEAIEVIRKYKNGENALDTNAYKKALRTINRFALRITNEQFALLLEMNVKLPRKINMTMEQRLEELKEFDSFYEKAQSEKNNAISAYIRFLRENKRRPDLANEKEFFLQKEYEKQLFKTSGKKLKEVINTILELNLSLTTEEAILSKRDVEIKTIEDFIASIRNKLLNNQKVTKEELKMLRSIEQKGYSLKCDISSFIKMINYINMIDESLVNYQSDKLNDFQKSNVMRSIFTRSKFFTKYHIEKLKSLNIAVPSEIIEELNSIPECINMFEHELIIQESFWIEFIEYLKANRNYPDKNSDLMKEYRLYLARISKSTLIQRLEQIKSLGITLGIEEKILLQDFENEDVKAYFESIKEKIKSGGGLDALEARTCSVLDNFDFMKEYRSTIRHKVSRTPEMETRIINNCQRSIRANPFAPIDIENNYALSNQSKRRLEIYKTNLMGKTLFSEVLKSMKTEKKPLSSILDKEKESMFNELIASHDLDGENQFLLNQIRNYDREYSLRERAISIDTFVKEYIAFIQNSNGIRPNVLSSDDVEQDLATKYEIIKELLDENDIQQIERAIKSVINTEDIKSFYPKFIEFIQENGRFPCGNSDNPTEVHLNTLFQNIGSNLTKEQTIELKRLKKIYGKATILANIEFAKRKDQKK